MNDEKLVEEFITELETRAHLETTFDKLAKNIFSFETVYYADIISIVSVFNGFKRERDLLFVGDDDSREINNFFNEKRIEIADKIIAEQKAIYEENFKSIRRKLDKIPNIIASGDVTEAINFFNELFLDFHSKYHQEFQRKVSKEFDPREGDYSTFKQNKAWYLLLLKDKVLFEKQLIHQDILIDRIYSNFEIKNVIELLNKGEIFRGLRFLENLSIQHFFTFKKKYNTSDDYTRKRSFNKVFREPSNLVFTLLELEDMLKVGVISRIDYYLKKFELVNNILSYVEHFIDIDAIGFFKSIRDKIQEETIFSSDIKENVRTLLSKSKIKEAIDALEDYLPEDSHQEIMNELIIIKARLSKNEQDKRKGIDYDLDLENKLINALLELINR